VADQKVRVGMYKASFEGSRGCRAFVENLP